MPTPNTVLMSTAKKATDRVSWSAWITSGSAARPSTGPRPSAKVALTTSATGQTTRRNR